MATINNGDIIKNIIKKAKINTSIDKVPSQLAEKVVPVMEVTHEKLIKIQSGSVADSTSVTIHTTHATKDTYLIGASLTIAKDAVSDSLFTAINVTPFGNSSTNLLRVRHEPTTAGQLFENVDIKIPIKLAKNTTITATTNTATGSIDYTGIIYYYEVD